MLLNALSLESRWQVDLHGLDTPFSEIAGLGRFRLQLQHKFQVLASGLILRL